MLHIILPDFEFSLFNDVEWKYWTFSVKREVYDENRLKSGDEIDFISGVEIGRRYMRAKVDSYLYRLDNYGTLMLCDKHKNIQDIVYRYSVDLIRHAVRHTKDEIYIKVGDETEIQYKRFKLKIR